MSEYLITATALQARLSEFSLFDCRFTLGDPESGWQAYQQSHIPGAIYANLDRDLSGPVEAGVSGRHPLPNKAKFTAWLRRCGVDKHRPVVVYDSTGGMIAAARLWWLMRWAGLEHVMLLDGGWSAWQKLGGELSNVEPDIEPSDFMPAYQDHWVVSADRLLAGQGRADTSVLDARNQERFAGKVEPIDPAAGHIPGAVCFFCGDNLDPEHYFLPADELRQRFMPVVADKDEVICYCGSGVTACHNILALQIAGFNMPLLYPGSWSEWVNNPTHPIAKEG